MNHKDASTTEQDQESRTGNPFYLPKAQSLRPEGKGVWNPP